MSYYGTEPEIIENLERKITYWQDLAVANRKVAEAAQAQRDKLAVDADHFFVLSGQYLARANNAEAQRDKLVVVLKTIRKCLVEGAVTLSEKTMAARIAIQIDNLMQECGK